MTDGDEIRRQIADLERQLTQAKQEQYRREFAIHREAEPYGRGIMTGGSGWRDGLYGAVVASYPEGSRVARPDSWHCHHRHPGAEEALRCALEEVKRLAAGGEWVPCTDWPGCTEPEDVRYFAEHQRWRERQR